MNEPISHMLKRRKIESRMRSALANQPLVLDDGSGQQVGTYEQGGLFTRGGEVSTQKGQKEEQLEALAKRKKALAAIAGTKKALKKGKFFGEKEDELDMDIDETASDSKEDKPGSTDKPDNVERKTFQLSKSSDASTAAMENASSMAQLTDNPYAQGGAALLGVLQADQARKDANRQIEYQAKMAGAQGKSQIASMYKALGESMKGMLS